MSVCSCARARRRVRRVECRCLRSRTRRSRTRSEIATIVALRGARSGARTSTRSASRSTATTHVDRAAPRPTVTRAASAVGSTPARPPRVRTRTCPRTRAVSWRSAAYRQVRSRHSPSSGRVRRSAEIEALRQRQRGDGADRPRSTATSTKPQNPNIRAANARATPITGSVREGVHWTLARPRPRRRPRPGCGRRRRSR